MQGGEVRYGKDHFFQNVFGQMRKGDENAGKNDGKSTGESKQFRNNVDRPHYVGKSQSIDDQDRKERKLQKLQLTQANLGKRSRETKP